MRMHINKSLKTRCKAIQAALSKFNAAAKAINRPQLDWSQVSTYGSLAEFKLLHECRYDIHSESWADSVNRQAAVHSLKIDQAKEEQEWLNSETQRLITYMHDEESDFDKSIKSLGDTDPPLATELECVWAQCICMNNLHRARI